MSDYFSKQSDGYAKFRPNYPEEFFSWLATQLKDRECAWDCATGSGQAARSLAHYFKNVIATDLSPQQVEKARTTNPNPQIDYRVEFSESTSIPAGSVSLITVGQALHWFELDKFYEEVRRVLKPGGVLAVFGYRFFDNLPPDLDSVFRKYSFETLGPFWPVQNKILWDGYQTIPFPFQEISSPPFFIKVELTLDQLIGYCQTWSAAQLYLERQKKDSTVQLRQELLPFWKNAEEKRAFSMSLVVRVGRNVV